MSAFTLCDDLRMVRQRIVVGAAGDEDAARRAARTLRDLGHEVVFVGGHQSAAQLVGAAVSEDATRIVAAADPATLAEITGLARAHGLLDVAVEPAESAGMMAPGCDAFNAREPGVNG